MPIYYNDYWIPENIDAGIEVEDYQIVKVFPYVSTDITWGVEIKKKRLIEDDPELKDAFI